MAQYYISEQSEIRTKLKTLTQTEVSEDGWTHYYDDSLSGEHWLLTSYDVGFNSMLLLKKLPLLSEDQMIEVMLTSKDNNNIAGAIFDIMSREETDRLDFRMLLIEALETFAKNPLTASDKERVKLIIQHCQLTDSRNRREIMGKPYSQIEADAYYFKSVAEKAQKILEGIQ